MRIGKYPSGRLLWTAMVIYYYVMKKILMKGNEAIAEAAVQAGCRFYAGYPITPQNGIP
jgi:TPP-dependent indolepyruvate ferredoxin oxidoreductase alpha subunit